MSRIPAALVSKVPAGVSACSAIVYFACSEGFHNYLATLWQAVRTVAEHLR